MTIVPTTEQRADLGAGRRAARDRPAAVDQGAAAMARPRDVPARAPKAERQWPDLSDARARGRPTGSSACARRQARARRPRRRGRLRMRSCHTAALGFAAPARGRGAHPFRRSVGLAVPIDYDAEAGPKLAIRVQELFGLDRHPTRRGRARAARARAVVAGASAGPGHPRSAGLLARQLRVGQSRDEGPLSAPSLARRSARRAAHPPRQAARVIEHSQEKHVPANATT